MLPFLASRLAFNSLLPYRHRLSSPDQSKGLGSALFIDMSSSILENTHTAVATVKECGENWARDLVLSSWRLSGCGWKF